jgi:hypothetical protein
VKFELVILKNLDLVVLGKSFQGNMPIDSNDVEIISTNEKAIIGQMLILGFSN